MVRGLEADLCPGTAHNWIPMLVAMSSAHLELLQQHHICDLLLILLGLLGLPVLLLGGVAVHGAHFEEAIWEERKASISCMASQGPPWDQGGAALLQALLPSLQCSPFPQQQGRLAEGHTAHT